MASDMQFTVSLRFAVPSFAVVPNADYFMEHAAIHACVNFADTVVRKAVTKDPVFRTTCARAMHRIN